MDSAARDINTFEILGSWSGETYEIYVYHDLKSGGWIVENELSSPKYRYFAYKATAIEYMNQEWPNAKLSSFKAK